jgi:hypothetical protein
MVFTCRSIVPGAIEVVLELLDWLRGDEMLSDLAISNF